MWIFTTSGFLSAVAHRDQPGAVMVRARERSHLATLAAFSCLADGAISETPSADYRWRITVTKAVFAEFVKAQAQAVDYDNFKNACHDRQPAARRWHHCLMDVWSAMRRL